MKKEEDVKEVRSLVSDNISKWILKLSIILIIIGVTAPWFSCKKNTTNNQITQTKNYYDLGTNTIIISKEKPEFQEIQIPAQGLSKLIEIPPGRCSWINAPGWLEYYFLTENGYIKNFSVTAGEQKWDKKISPSSRFKLKGQSGIAKIWLEPCPRNSRSKEMAHQKNQLCDSNLNDYSRNSTTCSIPIQ